MARGPRSRTTPSRLAVCVLACICCVLAPASMLAGVPSPVRLASTLGLFCLAPGAAVLPFVQPRHAAMEIGLVIGVSAAVTTVLAQGMLWLGAWSPVPVACALAAVCLPVVVAHLALPTLVDRAREGRGHA
jgi:hypothetical protein